jgi:hypothetical protein
VRREGRFRDTNNCGFLLFLLAVANTFYLRFITMIERYRLSTDHRRSSLASSVLLIQSMRERLAWPLTPLCGITARTSGGACDLGSEPQHSLAMASLHPHGFLSLLSKCRLARMVSRQYHRDGGSVLPVADTSMEAHARRGSRPDQ